MKRIDNPCPYCGREDSGTWFDPCPSDDCPSNSVSRIRKGLRASDDPLLVNLSYCLGDDQLITLQKCFNEDDNG